MNNEILFRAIGEVGDDLVARAEYPKKKNITWLSWAALAACAVFAVSLVGMNGMMDFGAKSAAPESQFAAADSAAEAPTESAPLMEEAVEEEAVAESTTAEEPAAAPTVHVVFVGNTYVQVENDAEAEPLELVGFAEEGHPDYIGCEVYSCADDDCIFVLHEGEYELFRLEG